LGPYPNLDVRATNSKGSAASNLFDVEVVASEIAPVFVPPIPDQIVQVGVPIVQFALAAYFTGTPATYTIDSGAFPTGLTMNTAGQVNGTASVAGPFTVVVRATNGAGTDVTTS
ncbi:unnamed protein product, partial [marine sediment metagenome]